MPADALGVLRVTCLASLAVAALTSGAWAARRYDALGRARGFPAITVVLALLIATGTGIPVVRHARLERKLSNVASDLAGTTVKVRCQTLSQAWTSGHGEAGYVRFGADGRPERLATITVDTCRTLRSWAGSDHDDPTLNQVISVHVLTHEAMHVAGHRDEAVAECAAVQRDARAAVLLGATVEQARALARTYWQQVYPRMADNYRTGACADGGSLDEHLPDAPWTLGTAA